MNSVVLIDRKTSSLVVPPDPRVLKLFSHARALPDGSAVLPHKPDETRVLRNMGFAVPSPIVNNYDWGGTTPFNAQKVTAAMLVVEPRAFVFNGLGTGKTRAVLYAFDYLRQNLMARRLVVAAPLSTLNFTWVREAFEVFPRYNVGVVYGTAKKRREMIKNAGDFDILVVNHDGLSIIEKELSQVSGPDDIICFDEVSMYRNARTKKFKTGKRLSEVFGRVWGLTGTPTPREPTDAFGIVKLINPDRSNQTFTAFRNELMTKHGHFLYRPKPGAQERVFEIMQPAVRFTLEECVDMPPVVRRNDEVALSKQQAKVLEALRKYSVAMLEKDGEISAANEGVLLNKMLQVCCGIAYGKDGAVFDIDPGDRLKTVVELIEENDRNAIVFCPFTAVADRVHAELSKSFETHLIYGKTSSADRDKAFSRFMSDSSEKQVIAAHPAAMSHGLTLTSANLVIWYSAIYNLETYEQANARVIRPGQDASRVLISHMIGSAIERRAYRRLKEKQTMQGVLLDLLEQ